MIFHDATKVVFFLNRDVYLDSRDNIDDKSNLKFKL